MENNSVPKGVWIFWLTVASIVTIWFLGTQVFHREYNYLQTLILALTFFAVVIYTIDTRRMQRAMVNQTNLSILPVFVVYIGDKVIEFEGRRHDVLELENIGNGVALNVLIDTINIVWSDPAIERVWPTPQIIFNPIMAIKPSERVPVTHRSSVGPNGDLPLGGRHDFLDKLARRADNDYELKIRFSDVIGNRYLQTIHVGESGIWPGAVIPDNKGYLRKAAPISNNPFVNSPLKYLRMRGPRYMDGR